MTKHDYEVRPRQNGGGFHLISDRLPFGRLWYGEADAAIGYAKFYSRSYTTEIRIYDQSGALVKTHRETGNFQEP